MKKIVLNGFGILGRLPFFSSIGSDSFSYAELKETAENLALAEKIKEIAYKKPTRIDIDTSNLPKERYHDRTFPQNYWKKKKAKRRMQNQSRKQKYL